MAYYTPVQTFTAYTLARGVGDVLAEFLAVASAFDTVEAAITALTGSVSSLEAGETPGWGGAIDSRWKLGTVAGTDSITAVASQSPAASDVLADGVFYLLSPAVTNTGAVTLDIGTTEGTVDVKKGVSGTYTALAAGDLQAGQWYILVYDSAESAWYVANYVGSAAASGGLINSIETGNVDPMVIGTKHHDRSGGNNTHVLPLLSGLSEGDETAMYLGVSDRICTVKEHASDSNAEIWTGVARGDFAHFVVTNGAWEVTEEKCSILVELALQADETVGITTTIKIFDGGSTYAVASNVGSYWDNTTNHRFDAPNFNMLYEVFIRGVWQSDRGVVHLYKTGANVTDSLSVGDHNSGIDRQFALQVDNTYLELYAENGAGSTRDIRGDAANDETYVTIRAIKRIR